MDIKNIAEMLHPLEMSVIVVLKEGIELKEIIAKTKLQEVEVMRALQWLENKKVLKIKSEFKETINLDSNGIIYLKNKLPERRFLEALSKELTLKEIREKANLSEEEVSISLGLLKKKAAIEFANGKVKLTDIGKRLLLKEFMEEGFMKKLPLDVKTLSEEDRYCYEELKKRKNIIKTDIQRLKFISLTNLYTKLTKEKMDLDVIGSLTPELIKSGEWKNRKFRRYDLKINVPQINGGKKHFVKESLEYAKKIWTDMGFKEMTGDMINTSFWNFDVMFTAQDHPVREMQDTFFIKTVEKGKLVDKKIVDSVRKSHEKGVGNSTGWNYKWDEEIAKTNVLRTHTTVLSAKTLYKLKKEDMPAKFFAIGKCFRNEAIDWSHLFEFNQTEGIVIDPDVNFRNLLGYLKEFFKKMGFEKARFRPAYFPYTEPNIEIDVFHPVHKKWLELGGAGIFRPEVTIPLLGDDIPVLAWGPGFDRIILEYYSIIDIRELYNNDIEKLRKIKSWNK